jgi:hypothetical protein
MEIYISDWIHKFQNKTGLDAKANLELYKSKRVCSAYWKIKSANHCGIRMILLTTLTINVRAFSLVTARISRVI